MKKIARYIICLLILIATLGCKNEKTDNNNEDFKLHLNSLSGKYNYLGDINKWSLLETAENVDATYFHLEKEVLDTVEILSFFYYPNEDRLALDTYLKRIKEDKYIFILEMNEDTLFYYRLDTITKNKDFIVGKYAYLYKNDELSPDDFDYYYLHSDSLNKVRGNKILALPTLSNKEKEQIP